VATGAALRHQLSIEGYQASFVDNGVQALECLLNDIPDVVITDIEMPGLTGIQFVQHMRARAALRDVPVIFISANIDLYRISQRHVPLGTTEYMRKPIDSNLLMNRVEALAQLTPRAHTEPTGDVLADHLVPPLLPLWTQAASA
jgi:CheY-like chemotaxis protein